MAGPRPPDLRARRMRRILRVCRVLAWRSAASCSHSHPPSRLRSCRLRRGRSLRARVPRPCARGHARERDLHAHRGLGRGDSHRPRAGRSRDPPERRVRRDPPCTRATPAGGRLARDAPGTRGGTAVGPGRVRRAGPGPDRGGAACRRAVRDRHAPEHQIRRYDLAGAALRRNGAAEIGIIQKRIHPCGWIVDVRENSGGDVVPMLLAVGPVLGSGPVIAFTGKRGIEYEINTGTDGCRRRRATSCRPIRSPTSLPLPPSQRSTGPHTFSAGEAVMLAFRGRRQARSFGGVTRRGGRVRRSTPASRTGRWSSSRRPR